MRRPRKWGRPTVDTVNYPAVRPRYQLVRHRDPNVNRELERLAQVSGGRAVLAEWEWEPEDDDA